MYSSTSTTESTPNLAILTLSLDDEAVISSKKPLPYIVQAFTIPKERACD